MDNQSLYFIFSIVGVINVPLTRFSTMHGLLWEEPKTLPIHIGPTINQRHEIPSHGVQLVEAHDTIVPIKLAKSNLSCGWQTTYGLAVQGPPKC